MSNNTHEVIKRAIRQFENGEMKVGDIVFCRSAIQDVILLEEPPNELINYYYKKGVISGNGSELKYRTLDGKSENIAEIYSFIKISKGRFFVNYEIKGNTKKEERKAFNLEYAARKDGFKVIRVKTSEGWYIRIFGDSQKEVDHFLYLFKLGQVEDYILDQETMNIKKLKSLFM